MWSHHPLLPAVLAGAVLVLLVRTLSTYLSRRKFKLQHGCRPIRTRFRHRDPFLGIDFLFFQLRTAAASRILDYQHERSLKYGPTFDMYLMVDRFINTTDPENIKTVLALRFKDYDLGLRKGSMHRLLGDGIFCSDGERWHASRNLIRPNFVREQVADIDAFERHFQVLLSLIPRDGTTVDLQDLFFRLTIDTATEFLFGQSVKSLEAAKEGRESDSEFAEAFNYAQKDTLARFRLRQFSFLHRDSKADWAVKFVHDFVDGLVDEALRQRQARDMEKTADDSQAKYVFLHELAKATTDRKVLRDELLNVLLAGRDTTASLLSNFFFILAKRPDIWTKLKTEVAKLNGELPTYEMLRDQKYLRYCIYESLRLHPVVPLNARRASVDTVLPKGGGPDGQSPIFVEKGTMVSYSTYILHRRTDYYGDDAGEFKPERWETLRPGWEYLPFNGGPRICVGQQYALTEAKYVTTRIMQEFERMESRDLGPWVENLSLTLCSKSGTKVGMYAAM